MTAKTSKSYVYSSLFDTEFKRPFRILWLDPSEDFDAPLRCRLTTHDLTWKQTPWIQYEALSYSWNSPTHSETPLLCEDGLQLPITKSLNSALRHLRQPDSVRRLWIDQVCINQTDLDEKSHQIAQMKAIYSRSRYILIWLGEESHSGEQVLRFLMSLDESCINIKDQLLHFFPKNGLSALEHFFSRAWFHRRWVIQEACQATSSEYGKETMVVCGTESMSWHQFGTALRDVRRAEFVGGLDHSVLERLEVIFLLTQNIVGQLTMRWGRGRYRILNLLTVFEHTQCSDDKDRLLALLNTAEDVSLIAENMSPENSSSAELDFSGTDDGYKAMCAEHFAFEASYAGSTEEMYRRFAKQCLCRESPAALDILHCAGAFRASNSTGLPTWVPDWRSPSSFRPLLNVSFFAAGLCAPLGTKETIRTYRNVKYYNYVEDLGQKITAEENHMTFIGAKVEVIHEVCNQAPATADVPRFAELLPSWKEFLSARADPDPYAQYGEGWTEQDANTVMPLTLVASGGHLELFGCRTIANEVDSKPWKQVSSIDKLLEHYEEALQESTLSRLAQTSLSIDESGLGEKAVEYLKLVFTTMRGRNCFKTIGGLVGLGPMDVEPGDSIVIPVGTRTPFVFQKRGSHEIWRLLGDCYLHGVMNANWLDSGEFERLHFTIA